MHPSFGLPVDRLDAADDTFYDRPRRILRRRRYGRLAAGTSGPYIWTMHGIFPFLIGFAAFVTLGILIVGMFSMVRGGEFNRRYGNKLMQYRVVAQAIALGLVMLALYFGGR